MSLHHDRIPSRTWARVRRSILERDGYRCAKCGRAGRLEVDHVTPLDHGGAALDPNNLQTLCRDCHIEKTYREAGGTGEKLAWRRFVNRF